MFWKVLYFSLASFESCNAIVMSMDVGAGLLGFTAQLWPSLPVWPWASHLTSLCPIVLSTEMEMTAVPTIRRSLWGLNPLIFVNHVEQCRAYNNLYMCSLNKNKWTQVFLKFQCAYASHGGFVEIQAMIQQVRGGARGWVFLTSSLVIPMLLTRGHAWVGRGLHSSAGWGWEGCRCDSSTLFYLPQLPNSCGCLKVTLGHRPLVNAVRTSGLLRSRRSVLQPFLMLPLVTLGPNDL